MVVVGSSQCLKLEPMTGMTTQFSHQEYNVTVNQYDLKQKLFSLTLIQCLLLHYNCM